jgi:hypothetical protein
MMQDDDRKFLEFWEPRREKRGTLRYQILYGLPLGLLVSLPILINFLMGRFWYKRADAVGSSQFNPLVLVVAVLVISVFFGLIYKKFQWERNEDRYRELMSRKRD